jgi:hypothetical protein
LPVSRAIALLPSGLSKLSFWRRSFWWKLVLAADAFAFYDIFHGALESLPVYLHKIEI